MGTRSADSSLKLSLTSTIKNTLTDTDLIPTYSGGEQILTSRIQDGLLVDKANRFWESRDRSLSSSATETLDIYSFAGLDVGAGSGCDALGQTLVMEEIVTLIIKQESGAGSLEIEPGASNGLTWIGTHTVATGGALKLGGVLMKHCPAEAPFDLSSTIKNIKFTANGGAVTYSIYILGRSDDDESSSTSSNSSSSTSTSSLSSSSSTSSGSSLSSSSTSSLSSSSTSSLSSTSTSSLSSSSSSSS